MKFVLRRALGGDEWEQVRTIGYAAVDPRTNKMATLESSMENLIIAHPRVLLSELTKDLPVVVVKDHQLRPDRERGHSGDLYPDLIAFDSAGRVYAIECKLAKNPESREHVLEQVLQYGERLVELRYEAIDSSTRVKHEEAVRDHARAARKAGVLPEPAKSRAYVSIAQRMEREPGVLSGTWSATTWQDEINAHLMKKEVRLVVAVDFLHDPLRETLGRRNARVSSDSFHAVWALELTRIKHVLSTDGEVEAGLEFVLPQVSVPRSHTTDRAVSFPQTLKQATLSGRKLYRRLDAWAEARGLERVPTNVSYQVRGRDGKRLVTLYLTKSVDKVELNLAPLAESDAQEVRRKLTQLFGEPVASTYPNIASANVEKHWARFAGEVLEQYEGMRAAGDHDGELSEGGTTLDRADTVTVGRDEVESTQISPEEDRR